MTLSMLLTPLTPAKAHRINGLCGRQQRPGKMKVIDHYGFFSDMPFFSFASSAAAAADLVMTGSASACALIGGKEKKQKASKAAKTPPFDAV